MVEFVYMEVAMDLREGTLMNIKVFMIYYLGKMIPDEVWVKMIYRIKMRRKLNLRNPKTFNEKLSWLKLHDRNPLYTMMVDKLEAKKYVENIIGRGYIIPTIMLWDTVDEIDFDSLPKQFVLKCTHNSGGVIVCRDKERLSEETVKKRLKNSLKKNFYWLGREWPYRNVKPRILVEQYMEDSNDTGKNGLTDYKFYCFNGKAKYLYVSTGLEDHKTAQIGFLTMDWKFAPFGRSDYKAFDKLPLRPVNLFEMVRIAEKLSRDFLFLRVDLYEINGKIYFSELTFTPCSGMMPFSPYEWDERLGLELDLPYNGSGLQNKSDYTLKGGRNR